MAFINESDFLYSFLSYMTTNITGSWFLTLFLFSMLIIMVGVLFKMPIELSMLLVFPMLVGFVMIYGQFVSVLAVAIILLGFLITKNLINIIK